MFLWYEKMALNVFPSSTHNSVMHLCHMFLKNKTVKNAAQLATFVNYNRKRKHLY